MLFSYLTSRSLGRFILSCLSARWYCYLVLTKGIYFFQFFSSSSSLLMMFNLLGPSFTHLGSRHSFVDTSCFKIKTYYKKRRPNETMTKQGINLVSKIGKLVNHTRSNQSNIFNYKPGTSYIYDQNIKGNIAGNQYITWLTERSYLY